MFGKVKTIKFGKYIQGKKIFGKDIKTPIEWYILDKKDNKYLLLSKYCLVGKEYNDKEEPVTWEKSSLRYWLNNEDDINNSFILNAFSDEEEKKIVTTKLLNNANSDFNVEGGNETFDKIFILSVDEYNKYLKNNVMKYAAPTKYLLEKNHIYVVEDYKTNYGEASTFWRLRTPGYNSITTMVVTPDGVLYPYSGYVKTEKGPLRVALWINLY